MNSQEIRQEDKVRRAHSDQVAALCALFADAQPTERLGANRSFPVQDSEQAWLVLEGSVDLFVSWQGRRHHLVRAESGTAIFGLADALNELTVFAVPGNGTVLLPATRRQLLDALPRRDRGSHAVRSAVAGWVAELTAIGLARADQDVARLSPNCPASIAAGGSLWSPDGSLCVDLPTDVLLFPDGTPFAPGTGGVAGVPLSQAFWFRTGRDIEVVPIALEEWLGRPQLGADLDCLHALALDIQRRLIAGRERVLAEALVDRARRDEIRLSDSLRLLAATNTDRALPLVAASSNSYIAAAALVLAAVGSALPQSGSAERVIRSARDPVFAIASACGLLYRKVHLVEDWWNRDHGPILAVLREEGTACALLPRSATSYWLVDPERGERQLLTADLAARLSDEAYTFVTPLPEEPVSGLALLKFGSRGFKQDISALIGTILVVGLLSMVTPVVTGWIMNPVIPYAQTDQLTVLAIALVIAGLASFAFSLIQNVAVLRLEGGMNARVAAAVWDRLLRLPAGFFRRFTVGDLANRALGVDQIRQIVSSTVMASILHSTAGLMSLGLMFYYNNKLALVVSGVAALYVAISFLIAREVRSRNREIAEKTGRLQGFVVQLLNAVTRLRVSGAEGAAFTQWSRQYASLMATSYHQLRLNNLQTVFQSLFNFLTLLAVFVAVGLASGTLFATFQEPKDWSSLTATIATVLPPPIFVAFNVAYGQFIASVFGLAKSWISLLNVAPLHQRARPILEAAVETRGSAQDPGEIIGNVEIRDIHFRYAPDSPPVLNGLTLLAEAGKLIAVVGPSGAGKSSLVRLLLGFDDPQRGSIFIDGKDIRHLNKRALRQQFGVVLQNGRVLSGSVYHNITAGAHVSREEAWEAARIAGLDKDIRALPMGMDTFLNEGASTISGGQRQRLMIARAVVRRPKLLIFDEATSALDNQTQEEVRRNLEKMNCTRIVIAHRLSSIANADRIYVLDGGQVVEQGSADQLMALNGRFAEMARRQIA